MKEQPNWFPKVHRMPSEWVMPDSFPDLSEYDEIAIDLETKDPDLNTLFNEIAKVISKYKRIMTLEIPFSRMDIVTKLHQKGSVLEEDYGETFKLTVVINTIFGNMIFGDLL